MTDTAESSAPEFVETFDPRAVLRLLRERKWVILGTASIVLVATVFYTLRQPKVYEAICTIQYDPTPPRALGSEVEDVAAPAINFWMTKEWYETQNQIIKSRTVAERVVQALGLNESPDFFYVPESERHGWESATVSATALELIQRLTVDQAPDSRLVSIKVRDRDPERATLVANSIAHAYIEHTREERMGATGDALVFLGQRLDSLTSELQSSEQALHDWRENNNVLSVSLEDRQNVIARDLEHYSSALADATTRRIAVGAKLTALRAANSEDPMRVDATFITENASVAALRTSYRELAADLAEKSVQYGPNHPEVRAATARLEIIRQQMREQVDALINGVASELREMRTTEAGLHQALEDVQAAGLALNQQEIRYNALKRRRENTEKLYDIVLQRTTETDLTKMQKLSTVRMVDEALQPTVPVSPLLPLNLAAGIVAGLVLGLGLAVLLSQMDRTLKTGRDIEGLGLTLLGVLPSIHGAEGQPVAARGRSKRRRPARPSTGPKRDFVVHDDPMSSAAESARAIRTNLTFMGAQSALGTLVLTSPSPLEGKTTVAISLAIALAQGGKKVLLVDTDMRRPRLHRAFGRNAKHGVSSVLVGAATLDEALQTTEVPNLSLLPCGPIPPNPSELLHTAAFSTLLGQLRERFDHVLFDSPPLGAVPDSAIIAPQVDGAILVMKSEKTTRDAAASAMKQLRNVGANLLGGVLNDVDLAKQEAYYGGHYYYSGYYYGTPGDDKDTSDSDSAQAAE